MRSSFPFFHHGPFPFSTHFTKRAWPSGFPCLRRDFCFQDERKVTCKPHASPCFAFLRCKPSRRIVLGFLVRRKQSDWEAAAGRKIPDLGREGVLKRQHVREDGCLLYLGHGKLSNRALNLARGVRTPSSAHQLEHLNHWKREARSCSF